MTIAPFSKVTVSFVMSCNASLPCTCNDSKAARLSAAVFVGQHLLEQFVANRYDRIKQMADLSIVKYGRIDAIFNNAGIMPTAPLAENRKQEWKAMLDVNIMGVLNGISAVLPIMQKQHSGKNYYNIFGCWSCCLSRIHHEENRKWVQQNSANPELSMKSEDIADAVAYVVGTPNSVSISEMVIRPTKQPI